MRIGNIHKYHYSWFKTFFLTVITHSWASAGPNCIIRRLWSLTIGQFVVTICFCDSQKYVFHIACKWALYGTHSGPISTLTAWPSEKRLYEFYVSPWIFIQINNFFELLVPRIEPLFFEPSLWDAPEEWQMEGSGSSGAWIFNLRDLQRCSTTLPCIVLRKKRLWGPLWKVQ